MKLIGILMPIIIAVMTAIILLIYANASRIVLAKSEENLQLNTESVVNSVSAWMNKVITGLNTQRDTIEYFSLEPVDELNYIKHTANQSEAYPAGIYIALVQGSLIHASFVPGPEYNVFEKSWYKDGLKSEDFIFGSVYFDEDSQSYVVGASGILKDKSGKIRGVAAADIYLDAISQIVAQVQLGKTGGVFLVDKQTNTVIGHKDSAIVGTALAEQENQMYSFVLQQLTANQTGLQTYVTEGGDQTYLDIQDVPNSQWAAIAYEPRNEVMADLIVMIRVIIAIAVVSVLVLLFLIIALLWRMIIRPVRKIDAVAQNIADGKLDQSIDYQSGDELGQLAANFNKTVDRLRDYVDYIAEISSVLDEMANGNLDFQLTYDYAGEFARVKQALEHISFSLNDTLGQISQSAEQVSSGADQISNGAQALSQGATQQASSVQELAATISEVSSQITTNAQSAIDATQQANNVGKDVQESNRRMQDMLSAMREINATSGEIEKIIKTIEDIAFQTNILALNAAVEAARAGAAGKGFAVVADEVRNLANKSQEASKNTSALIENSLRATENGMNIAGETADALGTVVKRVKDVADAIGRISQASEVQAQSIAQVNLGVDQISSVVQTNSATAEESAAASEELSAQAATMNQLVGQFKLKQTGAVVTAHSTVQHEVAPQSTLTGAKY